jgi:TolB-like protein
MADIFISYARADRARVAPLVAALEAQGWTVWWDPEITPGQEFDRQIARELDAARAVIVVWTPASVDSRWVRGEAREAADRGVLVPVRFDKARLPIDARAMHTTDLDGWDGAKDSRVYLDLCRALTPLVERLSTQEPASGAARERAHDAPRDATDVRSQPARGISICVLPFANMSGDTEQEYFSDGISEDIITDLSKVSALLVIARNTAFTFKGKPVDVKGVARQLGVSHVLEGSVRKAGNRVRITAQLIDGRSGGHLWAERYDRNLDDIFALQDEISQAIVSALKLRLLSEEKKAIEDRGTTSVEAYDKYLRAQAFVMGHGPAESGRAEALFREALAIDPGFGRARGGLCTVYWYRLSFAPERAHATLGDMESMVEEALVHAPEHWATHLASGTLRTARHDWLGSDRAFTRMKALAPLSDSSGPFSVSLFFGSVGRNVEGVAELTMARTADPLSLAVSQVLQQQLYIVGRVDDARAEYQRTIGLIGNREPAEHTALMQIWDAGDIGRTAVQFRRYLDNQAIPIPVLSQVLELLDQPAAALDLLRNALSDPANLDPSRMMVLSWYAARFGDAPLAVAAMRRAYVDLKGAYMTPLWFPFLREARQLPAFKTLVRDLGLYDYWRKSGKWGNFARPLGEDDFEVW